MMCSGGDGRVRKGLATLLVLVLLALSAIPAAAWTVPKLPASTDNRPLAGPEPRSARREITPPTASPP